MASESKRERMCSKMSKSLIYDIFCDISVAFTVTRKSIVITMSFDLRELVGTLATIERSQ